MNIELERHQIIQEINNVKDEWIMKAIKKLLDLDYESEVNVEHQQILDDRIAKYNADSSLGLEWEEVKNELLKK